MEKHIMGENGISYTLGEDGLYYPDLYLPDEWKVWNVEKNLLERSSERIISGIGACREVE